MSRVVAALLLATLAGCAEEVSPVGADCNAAHPCPGELVCVSGKCRELGDVVIGCKSDDECVVGVCLLELGFCVQCTGDDDCAQGVCLPAVYQCGCSRPADCATGRCYRDPGKTFGYCASCYADEQCQSGVCDRDTGVCEKVRRDATQSRTDE